jgi:hypothetical protein
MREQLGRCQPPRKEETGVILTRWLFRLTEARDSQSAVLIEKTATQSSIRRSLLTAHVPVAALSSEKTDANEDAAIILDDV